MQRGAHDGVSVEDEISVPMLPLDHRFAVPRVGQSVNAVLTTVG
jgi:hypothetical protein